VSETRRFTGGRIFTGGRFVDALLIEDGRVTAVGSDAEVARASPAGCEVEHLAGGLVVPGLVDAHLHVAELVRAQQGVALTGVASREDLADRVRRWAESHTSGPVLGRGWSADAFPDGKEPTRADLDRVVADRPVVLYQASGHAAVVNGAALGVAGYTDRSRDPPGGKLGRGTDGSLNGLLYERALEPVARFSSGAFPAAPEAIERTLRSMASLGLTSVGALSTEPEELDALDRLGRKGRLPIRIRAYVRAGRLSEVDPARPLDPHGGGYLSLVGTKSFADGAFGPRTAWLSHPYADRPDTAGAPTLSARELAAVVARTVRADLVPAVHAIGDRALAATLRALKGSRPRRAAPRVEHVALVPPELYPELDRVRPTLVVQPGFVWSDTWLEARLGKDRVRHAYPFRTLTERGHLLLGSSDAPYDPVDPWRGLTAAVTRTAPDGGSANPVASEQLTPEQAFQLYTLNAGWGIGEPDLGNLEVGARADLLALDGPDLGAAIGQGRSGVRAVWSGGQERYRRANRAGE
jgi:predicted amidohydrolase YtcJ